jgi:hypothetical protein
MDVHKAQRKAVWPAFQGHVIRELVPDMWLKSIEFANVIVAETDQSTGMVEFGDIVSRATLGRSPPSNYTKGPSCGLTDVQHFVRYHRSFCIWKRLSNPL